MPNEFLVNTYTAQWQQNPDITRLTDGSFVIVWDSFFSEDVGRAYYIAAQRFTSQGVPMGGETILSDVALEARYPRISALDDGGYAVSWEASPESILNDSDVFTRTFDADGTARGPARQVNFNVDNDVFAAETIGTSNGYLVIYTADVDRDVNDELWLRAYNAEGVATGPNIKVNPARGSDDFNPRAELLSNGDVIVIWDREELFGPDGIDARIFGPDGTPRGAAFTITNDSGSANGGFNLTKTDISVAGLDQGRFVVTYNRIDIVDGEAYRFVLGRIYEANGSPAGPEFVIDVNDDSKQEHTSVAALPGGGFVVTWDYFTDTPDNFEDVYAQVFNDFGQPIGDQITVPNVLTDSQEWSSVVGLDGGRFVVTYMSHGLDGDAEGIGARIFDVPKGNFDGMDLFGTNRADRLNGDYGDDLIKGFGGNDRLNGRAGHDRLEGGAGADRMTGGAGRDRLDGGRGNDNLEGGRGRDRLNGDKGNDVLNGGTGRDRLNGGDQNDRLIGAGGVDHLSGGKGKDRLFGGKNDDVLKGGGAKDHLIGGGGQDRLTGGGHADRFIFKSASDTGKTAGTRDVIEDFSRSQNDHIDLRQIDARTGGGNQAFEFIGNDGFSDTKGELRVRDTGRDLIVLGDRNGDGRADFSILVKDLGRLGADDFLL